MSRVALWWPSRRARPQAEDHGGGFLPGTFEPTESLGDTYPVPLDELPSQALAREARWHRRMYLLCVLFVACCYFGFIA